MVSMKTSKIATVFALIVLGLFQLISGLILYISGGGWRHRGSEIVVFGLERHVWKDYHFYIGIALIVVAVIHFTLNWKMFKAELRIKKN